jgi:1-deoxy-D-xylulose-5-phosphate reductoisomerase
VKQLAILGSTGSIGRQCLSVVDQLAERFGVVALGAGGNLDELAGQILRYRPELVSVADADKADELARRLREAGISRLPAIHYGRAGMLAVGTHGAADILVSAAVGVVGLEATYEAIKLGKTIALSNKEVLVAAGELVMAAAHRAGKELLPVDSEHNAVHQCLRGGQHGEVRKLVPYGVRRAVPEIPHRETRRRDPGGGPGASQLENGQPDYGGFGDDDEQGF